MARRLLEAIEWLSISFCFEIFSLSFGSVRTARRQKRAFAIVGGHFLGRRSSNATGAAYRRGTRSSLLFALSPRPPACAARPPANAAARVADGRRRSSANLAFALYRRPPPLSSSQWAAGRRRETAAGRFEFFDCLFGRAKAVKKLLTSLVNGKRRAAFFFLVATIDDDRQKRTTSLGENRSAQRLSSDSLQA